MKKCSKCGIEKSFSAFHKCSSNKTGVQSMCKSCKAEHAKNNRDKLKDYFKKYAKDNEGSLKEYRKGYYLKNKDSVKEYGKKRYSEKKDEIREKQKNYYEENKDVILRKNKEYRKEHPEVDKKYQKKFDDRYKKKYGFTHKQIRGIAIRANPNPQHCSKCGSRENPERHHPDYYKPQEIIWLCRECHNNHHLKSRKKCQN